MNKLQNKTIKQPYNQLVIYCDGASRGNPGPSAAAFVAVEKNDTVIHQAGEYLGQTTNNVAEYHAVLLALTWLISYLIPNTKYQILINLDSELLYKQIIGQYKVKANHLKPLHQQINQLYLQLQSRGVSIAFQHQLRHHNTLPDKLANQILDSQ